MHDYARFWILFIRSYLLAARPGPLQYRALVISNVEYKPNQVNRNDEELADTSLKVVQTMHALYDQLKLFYVPSNDATTAASMLPPQQTET